MSLFLQVIVIQVTIAQ